MTKSATHRVERREFGCTFQVQLIPWVYLQVVGAFLELLTQPPKDVWPLKEKETSLEHWPRRMPEFRQKYV